MSDIDIKGAAKGAFVGGIGAGLLGIGLYFVAQMAGATFRPTDPELMGGMEVLPPFQPLVICLIATIVSIGVLAGLLKATPAKAWRIFLGIAVVVFLLEFAAPFMMFDDTTTIVFLEIMHVPAAIGIVGGLHRGGRKA